MGTAEIATIIRVATSGDAVNDPAKAGFLSYASQDAQDAQRLCMAMRAAGIKVWFDQSELRGGDAWDASIRHQIKACALFIPLISHNTHTRGEGYFRLAWKLAVDRSHLMASDLPFLLRRHPIAQALKYFCAGQYSRGSIV